MADKVSTLILKVDLDCDLCYKKIRRTLSKLQEQEKIQSIFYDEKSQTVTISGPFDPQKLTKKLCSRACSVIKDMQIKDNKPKETKPPTGEKTAKPAEPAKDAKPAEAKTDKSSDKPKAADAKPAEAKPAKSDDKPKADAKPAAAADAKPAKSDDKPKDAEVKNDKPPVEVTKNAYVGQAVEFGQTGYQPAWSTGGPGCYCSPWGYSGDYKGCTCGPSAYGWAPEGRPVVVYGGPSYGYQQSYQPMGLPPVVYGGPSYGYQQGYQPMGPPPVAYGGPTYEVGYPTTSKFFCEEAEDPQASCSIM